jgi:hypothetical protein
MDAFLNTVVNTIEMLGRGIPGLVTAGLAAMLILLALVRREPGMMVLAALLAVPSAYIFGSWTGYLLFIRLLPILLLLSAYAIGQDDPIFMWGLAIPPFLFIAYFVFNLVVNNFAGL